MELVNKMDKKISIITASYNQGNFIEDAILSVMNQKYSNYEHIIVDGESNDETISILKKYKHLKWISEKDSGQTDALNKALKLVDGEIIGQLNADDYYYDNIFSEINDKLSDQLIDGIYGNLHYVDKSKNIIDHRIAKSRYVISNRFVSKFICFIPSTTFFFKKSSLKNNITYDNDMNFGMDKDLYANMYDKKFIIQKIEKNYAFMRLHENNKFEHKRGIKNFISDIKEGVRIYNKFSKFKLPNNFIGLSIYTLIRFILKCFFFIVFKIFNKKK